MNRSVVQILGLEHALKWYFHHYRRNQAELPVAIEALKAADRADATFEWDGIPYQTSSAIECYRLEPFLNRG